MAIVMFAVCVLGLALPALAMYSINWSEKTFTNPSGQPTTLDSSENIKDLIVKAGTSFFRGNANVNLLVAQLEAAELEGVSYAQLQITVADALANMKASRNYYQALINMAATLTYNPAVIDQLKSFDYLSISTTSGMNRDICEQLKGHLLLGDVRGVYSRLYTYTSTIVDILETVQKEMSSNGVPSTATIWQLNQECSHMLLFGQYIAQVFKQIRI